MGGIGDLGECVQAPIARRFAPNVCSALAHLGACLQAIEHVLFANKGQDLHKKGCIFVKFEHVLIIKQYLAN